MASDTGGGTSNGLTCCRTYPETNSLVTCILGTDPFGFRDAIQARLAEVFLLRHGTDRVNTGLGYHPQ